MKTFIAFFVYSRMRRLYFTDVHGSYKGLMQALERAKYDPAADTLYFGGDACDGWSEVAEVITFLKENNAQCVQGNHDEWALEYLDKRMSKEGLDNWFLHRGDTTVKSLEAADPSLIEYVRSWPLYRVLDDILIVHAGYTTQGLKENISYRLLWDRSYIQFHHARWKTRKHRNDEYSGDEKYRKVFIGHTPTIYFDLQAKPYKMGNIFLSDSGSAFTGCVSVIDIDTEESWQSDTCQSLYPGERGRNKKTLK